MPKQTLPLTDSQCKKLQPPNQLSDGGGLYLQARGNGKYWRFRYYRPSDNKRDEMRLGVYPEISLKEAREKREELRGLIAKGIDPKLPALPNCVYCAGVKLIGRGINTIKTA